MPHLVYSPEEIESCLHFIRLDQHVDAGADAGADHGDGDAPSSHDDDDTPGWWWPCLILENMSMLHWVCRERNYLQDAASQTERTEAFQSHRCRVDPAAAAAKRVVLLLGPNLPAGSARIQFETDDDPTASWTTRPFVGGDDNNDVDCGSSHHASDFCQAIGDAHRFLAVAVAEDRRIQSSSIVEEEDGSSSIASNDDDEQPNRLRNDVAHIIEP